MQTYIFIKIFIFSDLTRFGAFWHKKNAILGENFNICGAKISSACGCHLEMSGFFRIFKVSICTAKAHFYRTQT